MSDKNAPMDAGAKESSTPVVSTNSNRVAYALKTLVAEVLALFPETPHEFSEPDGRNTALAVTFDTSVFEASDQGLFRTLLESISSDDRLSQVTTEDASTYVSLRSNARTQDSRDPFDLAAIWLDMNEENEGFASETGETEFTSDDLLDSEVMDTPTGFSTYIDGDGPL